jgi:hypothetical protein
MPDVVVAGVRDESPDAVPTLDRHCQVMRSLIDLDQCDRPIEQGRAYGFAYLLEFLLCRSVVALSLRLA